MKPWERWAFNIGAAAVAVSGFAYFWMKYFAVSDDPFAVVNHPWESAMLNTHVLASPPFILVFGIILNSHIIKKLGASRMPNRKTGLVSFGMFAAMVCSGYLLQVAMSEPLTRALVWLHVGSGVIFTVTYAAHLVISTRLIRRRPAQTSIREVA